MNRVDFTQGLIVAGCVWATQLRHSWRRRGGSSVSALDEVAVHTQSLFVFGSTTDFVVFCATSPLWYVVFKGNNTL